MKMGGTKNRSVRHVPIHPRVQTLYDRGRIVTLPGRIRPRFPSAFTVIGMASTGTRLRCLLSSSAPTFGFMLHLPERLLSYVNAKSRQKGRDPSAMRADDLKRSDCQPTES